MVEKQMRRKSRDSSLLSFIDGDLKLKDYSVVSEMEIIQDQRGSFVARYHFKSCVGGPEAYYSTMVNYDFYDR